MLLLGISTVIAPFVVKNLVYVSNYESIDMFDRDKYLNEDET